MYNNGSDWSRNTTAEVPMNFQIHCGVELNPGQPGPWPGPRKNLTSNYISFRNGLGSSPSEAYNVSAKPGPFCSRARRHAAPSSSPSPVFPVRRPSQRLPPSWESAVPWPGPAPLSTAPRGREPSPSPPAGLCCPSTRPLRSPAPRPACLSPSAAGRD
jgi:hypothetical protein